METNLLTSEHHRTRILFLTDNLGGGTGNHLLSMIRHWNKSEWQAEIVSQGGLTARVTTDTHIEFLPRRCWFEKYPFTQARRFTQVRRYISKNPPHLVHSYFFWSIIYGRILKRLGRIQFLVENREDLGFNWSGREYALLRLTRAIPDRVICVSEAVRRVVAEKEGLDRRKMIVVHNGVEPAQRLPVTRSELRRELGMTENNLLVGMVANFNRSVKGVSYFLDAVPLILRAIPSARFLILGRGWQERALREKANTLGIGPYVVFAGFRQDIERYYAAMDVSVLTSLSEGLSVTLLESMSHGLPVVVTRVGGNPEVVVDGRTGYLVPCGDVFSFSARVIELLLSPELRTELGQEGRRTIEERFQIRNVAQQYLRVYIDVLQATTSPLPSPSGAGI